MGERSTSEILSVLRTTHERFVAAFGNLYDADGEEGATRPSYDDGWSVAQVASHLGSGCEIFLPYLGAGARGEPTPGGDRNQAIWDAWNAKTPTDQVRDATSAVAAFLDAAEALTDEEKARWRLEVFGMDQDLADFLHLRLNEHALHTWDITVAMDPTSTIPPDAAELVAENLGAIVRWAGKPSEEEVSVEVRTSEPELAYHLDLGPNGVALAPSLDDTSAPELTLPTEALVRLVYGRLDPDHTPSSVCAKGVDLELLRSVFPGL
ncbi:MAG TPA: maleylpyruvate isomerase family mycothiol-dependent enzyme [Nocardioides sp.]|jgi:uncharacterized protein (TIGR03083 family)|nr:maleylpyruvate isomerase family mycothiol-dependent enzyme [Nocardioides sp.]